MAGLSAVSSTVGAGVSQVRFKDHVSEARLKDQEGPSNDVRTAALQLIQRTLRVPRTTGRDLDVLA